MGVLQLERSVTTIKLESSFRKRFKKEMALEAWKNQPMRQPKIAKVSVHMGVGASGDKLEKAMTVLEGLAKQKPVKMLAKKTIRDFGIRKRESPLKTFL
jgi:large subunit ribosomal protein L5